MAARKSRRRADASTEPPVPCTAQSSPAGLGSFRGKGAKHAARCGGPLAPFALARMPPPPLTGAKRFRAGLGDVPLAHAEAKATRSERAACALAALLPIESAAFILSDPLEDVLARDPDMVAGQVIRVLATAGAVSLDGAYSVLGRLLQWARTHHPAASAITGSVVTDFLAANPPSAAVTGGITWLRDWCGLDLPARAPCLRPFRGRAPATSHAKETFTLRILLGLEALADAHPSPFVRGHAAAWAFLALHALRVEQSLSLVINSFVPYSFQGGVLRVTVASTVWDKSPDPSKRRPRPVWGIFEGIERGDAFYDALFEMLSGMEETRCLLRDTDSPSGDPTRASEWIRSPVLAPARRTASLQSLLTLPPISMSPSRAGDFGGHAAKRFLLNIAEVSPLFSPHEASELGRFSHSTAQCPDLVPSQAMLRAHELSASVLPGIYAGKAKVAAVFAVLAKAHGAIRAAAARAAASPELLDDSVCWDPQGPFSVESAHLPWASLAQPAPRVIR